MEVVHDVRYPGGDVEVFRFCSSKCCNEFIAMGTTDLQDTSGEDTAEEEPDNDDDDDDSSYTTEKSSGGPAADDSLSDDDDPTAKCRKKN